MSGITTRGAMPRVSEREKFSVAELFCGCGGFSHGFALTGRFNVVFGNDIKKEALNTFRLNHDNNGKRPVVIDGDIRALSTHQIRDTIEEAASGNLDVLIGGPPCQGFSQMRRSEERRGSTLVKFGGYNKLDQDPRNDLVLRFLEIAQALRPAMIVVENVPQMLTHHYKGKSGGIARLIREILEEMGYSVAAGVLNAADYGVPQLRERAIIMASSVGTISLPEPTHGSGRRPYVTVREAIADLPAPVFAGQLEPDLQDRAALNGIWNSYLELMRGNATVARNHFTRAYQQRIIRIIKEMKPGETWDSAAARMRRHFTELVNLHRKSNETPQEARRRLIRDGLINPVFYKDYYWSAYTRLDWEQPALTITANANFLGSGRFTHPDAHRGITMREAARLQSFDDEFVFYTDASGTDCRDKIGIGMDMIGEAVPPLLGKAIATQVVQHLDSYIRSLDRPKHEFHQ